MITKPIKTNVITGFLGVGKTSLIKQLLANKPNDETWAVLVNEFGEIGVDASLINKTSRNDVFIKEVAGGCLCCAAGVPTQVAINQIIQRAKPDRILIEPTGIGHPQQIIKVLKAPHYQQVIDLKATLCLVDARKVADPRYHQHPIFIEQLCIADVVIANKSELYETKDQQALNDFLQQLQLRPVVVEARAHFSAPGLIHSLLEQLDKPQKMRINADVQLVNKSTLPKPSLLSAKSAMWEGEDKSSPKPLTANEIRCKTNQGDDFYSVGWLTGVAYCFEFEKLMSWFESFKRPWVLRVKAVMITADGILAVNMVDGQLTLAELDETMDSRVEIISSTQLDAQQLQAQLLGCLVV
ncbi:CobW family GTP-binding protein [Shewanella aestuarii]|uniref:GTP-binding protein n=1 Tax=Shewanella aestuarii TaxID=1028752 RepID=A0A6G9QIX3_9GAMM|nr:GTP-binding protein [Shewanella aestuarii]QIR14017.1 GTP-binding protein [Shewanella aestuarii]